MHRVLSRFAGRSFEPVLLEFYAGTIARYVRSRSLREEGGLRVGLHRYTPCCRARWRSWQAAPYCFWWVFDMMYGVR